MSSQAPEEVLMVRPSAFGYNNETAGSNAFQYAPDTKDETIHLNALREFDSMVDKLRSHDIEVTVVEDSKSPITPDAIFPNNWFSTHDNGELILYPMEAKNRRMERRTDIISELGERYIISTISDWTTFETDSKYLEGTGSLVFDHLGKKVYVSKSSRTDELLVLNLCEHLGYIPVIFDAKDSHGQPIYHTNVMMTIATDIAIVCIDSIAEDDQENVINHLQTDNKQVIAIGYEQMNAFAGNMLEVANTQGEKFLAMSDSAFNSLVNGQINAITKFEDIITFSIPTIEQYGGGGVRCMMAGIHLPRK